jgi:hypothetical protein
MTGRTGGEGDGQFSGRRRGERRTRNRESVKSRAFSTVEKEKKMFCEMSKLI